MIKKFGGGRVALRTGKDSKGYTPSRGEPLPDITIPEFRARLTVDEALALSSALAEAVEAGRVAEAEARQSQNPGDRTTVRETKF